MTSFLNPTFFGHDKYELNSIEKVFSLILSVSGITAFVFLLKSSVNLNEASNIRNYLQKYFKCEKINKDLQFRIISFLESDAQRNIDQERQIIAKLPETLRQDLLKNSTLHFYNSTPFLHKNFSPSIVETLPN